MRINSRIVIDIASGEVISRESEEYIGPIEHLGGGKNAGRRNTAAAAAGAGAAGNTATNLASTDTTIQNNARSTAQPFVNSLVPAANGGLSPYAASQFGQEKQQIGKTYNDLSQVGLRQLGNRGLAAPGSSASIINTANRAAGDATTSAYNDAMQRTLGQGLAGINYLQGQQQIYNPLNALNTATGAYGTQATAGNMQTKQGSLLGDIGSGISGLAGIGASFAPS